MDPSEKKSIRKFLFILTFCIILLSLSLMLITLKGMDQVKNKKQKKVSKVMKEFAHGELHSGSKKGPTVTNPQQAKAIALSEAGLSKGKKK